MKIRLPAGLLEGRSLHLPRTTVIVLSGPGAVAKASPGFLSAALQGPGGVPAAAMSELYRFENPTRWFLGATEKMTRQVYDGLHGKTIRVPGTEIVLALEHVDKERTRLTVHWLPPSYSVEAVKAVITALSGDARPEVFKLKNREGQWGALCHPDKEIPHYAAVEVPGRANDWHTIKITIPGRLTECQHCSRTDHWSNKCPMRRQKDNPQRALPEADFPPMGARAGVSTGKGAKLHKAGIESPTAPEEDVIEGEAEREENTLEPTETGEKRETREGLTVSVPLKKKERRAEQSATTVAEAVTRGDDGEFNSPKGKEQEERKENMQKTWAEIVKELRPRRRSNSFEKETAPTQTENRNKESVPVTEQEIEQEKNGKEENEDFVTVVGKRLKRKMSSERSRSWSPQGAKTQKTYVTSDEEDVSSRGGASVCSTCVSDTDTPEEIRHVQSPQEF